MENVRKYRDIERVTTERRRNYLVSEPNCHYQIIITENVLAIEVKKTQILMNKPNYLGLSVLDLSKTVMYVFRYDYVKPKYGENPKLCYMDTGSFIVQVKTNDIYKDIAEDVEKGFDTSNFMIDRALPIGKNKKVIGLMKEELGGKIMKKCDRIRPKHTVIHKATMMKIKKRNRQKSVSQKEILNLEIMKNVEKHLELKIK